MYKVLLVDDEVLIREAISENIPWETLGFELLGTCENGREAMERIALNPPDLLLTDICMPFVDGIELARYTYENYPNTRTVIISGYDEFEYAKKAVRYQVMEYILKPITPSELMEVLEKARASLDEAHDRSKTMKNLKRAYASNLPLLQGRFLNSLLRGSVRPEGLEEKMEELKISLPGPFYNTAIVTGDDLSPFLDRYPGVQDDLALFSICNIAQELLQGKGCGEAFQDMDERTAIILSAETEEELKKESSEVLQEIQKTIRELLRIETTVGLGQPVLSVEKLHQSYDKAKAAAALKFLMGGGQLLTSEQIGTRKGAFSLDVPAWASQVVLAVKTGDTAGIEETIQEFAQELRSSYVNRDRSILYVQNLLLTVGNMVNLTEEHEEQIVKKEKELMNRIYTLEHLSEMAAEAVSICREISELLCEQRDGYGKRQAMMALDYIEKNYRNPEVSLNSVCSHLAMSTSYFSTLFKRCTGETFIETLTKKRMEKAKELLEHTALKNYEVADQVGYADPHYFSIAFKKATGKTPTEYAKEKRRG